MGEDKGKAGLVQALNDLCVLGKRHAALLEKINFDMSLLDGAAETARSVSALLARVNAEQIEPNDAKIIRDKAYSFLKQVVDQIYSFGQFAFRDNAERRIGYRSNYLFNQRGKSKKKSAVKEN